MGKNKIEWLPAKAPALRFAWNLDTTDVSKILGYLKCVCPDIRPYNDRNPYYGITEIDEPYSASYLSDRHIVGDTIPFLLRADCKVVNSGAVKRLTHDKLETLMEKFGEKNPSKVLKKTAKEDALEELTKKAPIVTKFYPVLYSIKDQRGYFFGSAGAFKGLSKVLFELSGVSPQPYTIDYQIQVEAFENNGKFPDVDSGTFLTWLWFKMEGNPTACETVQRSFGVGSRATVYAESDSVRVVSDDLEEARIAVGRGLLASQLEMYITNGDRTTTFVLNKDGLLDGIETHAKSLSEIDDFATLCKGDVDDAYRVVDEMFAAYKELHTNPLPDDVLKRWSVQAFCTKNAPDF